MPEQCMAVLKPPGSAYSYQCPAPAVPGEVYCPLHVVLEKRMKERMRKHKRLFEAYRKELMG